MDTKFSVALHVLTMLSESGAELSSSELAQSVRTNASYIRKVLRLLKNKGLITSQQGRSGYVLTKDPAELSLLEVYLATQETEHITLFALHKNPNAKCPVGRNIEKAVTPIFETVEYQLEADLAQKSLADVIESLYQVAHEKTDL